MARLRQSILLGVVAASGCSRVLGIHEFAADASEAAAEAPAADAPADAFVPDAALVCPNTYAALPGWAGVSRYRYVPETVGWVDAEMACEADGQHLVVIDTQAENDAIAAFASTDLWIGLDDRATEGKFVWVTGVALSYEHWGMSQPDNLNTENCVHVYANGTWNDAGCNLDKPALCECDGRIVK